MTGLKPGVEYAVCLAVHNVSKTEEPVSAVVSFATVPTPTTEAANPVGTTTATFNGKLSPLNATVATEYFFFYNLGEEAVCTDERETAPHESAGTGAGTTKAVSTAVTELEPNQKYTVCLDSTNAFGAEEDPHTPPAHFTTKPAPPEVTTEPATAIAAHEATLEAQVNPNNQETTYVFEYAPAQAELGTAGATKLPGAEPLPAEYAPGNPVSVTTGANLTQVSTYYYRVVAKNKSGEEKIGAVEHFKTGLEAPTATNPPAPLAARTATLHGVLNPNQKGELGTYEFRYRASATECEGENEQAVPAAPGSTMTGAKGQAAESAEITGLEPGQQYTFCLLVKNAAEEPSPASAPVTFRTLSEPPKILPASTSSTEVTDASAILGAEVNPGGGATTYHFEYDTTPYKEGEAPHGTSTPESGSIGSDNNPHAVSAAIEGLQPGTVYHYRVVATNATGGGAGSTVDGPDATFTTHASVSNFTLPDNRAWEQVSPVNKLGSRIEAITKEGGIISAAENGGAVAYVANGPIEGSEGNSSPGFSQILSVRGPGGGWSSRDLATKRVGEPTGAPISEFDEYYAFSPDLTEGILEPLGAPPLAPEAENNVFIRGGLINSNGTVNTTSLQYTPLASSHNTPPGTSYGQRAIKYVVASPDLKHVIVAAHAQLTPTPVGSGIYEWNNGVFSPISILPNEEFLNSAEAMAGDSSENVRNAVSENGEKVFWATVKGGAYPPHLYMRDVPHEHTVQVDAPQEHVTSTGEPKPYFQYATPDGERVYFKDTQRLTTDSTATSNGREGNSEPELYEYNTVSGDLRDLTPNPQGPAGESSDVLGEVIGASDNGEYVYFVAEGVLAGSNAEGHEPTLDAPNLYVIHTQNNVPTTTFIATLSNEDEHDWQEGLGAGPERQLVGLMSRVSPDGGFLAFMSDLSLTGYDNVDVDEQPTKAEEEAGVSATTKVKRRDEEVFEYDAASARLVCASCNPSGARPHGVFDEEQAGEGIGLLVDRPELWEGRWIAGSIPGWTQRKLAYADYQSRYLSDSGRLFFNSPDGLVPQDTNGKEDVYEYEPEGIESSEGKLECSGATSSGADVFVSGEGGCVGLISSGKSSKESAFLDASGKEEDGEEGGNVFFVTSAPLAPTDVDDAEDVYDAHVCSSAAPCPSSSVVSPPCTTEASCKAAPAVQPAIFGAPASSTFSGPANPVNPAAAAVKAKSLTRAQKLAAALKVCRKAKAKRKRSTCEKQARARFGPAKPKRGKKANTNRGASR